MTHHETPDPAGPNFTGGPVMHTGHATRPTSPTLKENAMPTIDDPTLAILKAHSWQPDHNACECGEQPTCEPPDYYNAGRGAHWHALHVAELLAALGTLDDLRSLAGEVLALNDADHGHSFRCAADPDGGECDCWKASFEELARTAAEVAG